MGNLRLQRLKIHDKTAVSRVEDGRYKILYGVVVSLIWIDPAGMYLCLPRSLMHVGDDAIPERVMLRLNGWPSANQSLIEKVLIISIRRQGSINAGFVRSIESTPPDY